MEENKIVVDPPNEKRFAPSEYATWFAIEPESEEVLDQLPKASALTIVGKTAVE